MPLLYASSVQPANHPLRRKSRRPIWTLNRHRIAHWGLVLVLLAGLSHRAGAQCFQPVTNYLVGLSPRSVAVGDVNGDGIVDLVTANFSSDNVSMLLGNGIGSFAAQTTFGVGATPSSVAVGDLNGDGKPDLVTANSSSNTVSVLLNTGNGVFAAQVAYSVGTQPFSVAMSDVNGDGKPDLVTANSSSNTVSVLLNNGNGSFAPPIQYPAGTNPFSVAMGDVNGDAKPDLVTANSGNSNVSVLLNTGNGSFAPQILYPVGNSPRSVAMSDLNGDGKPDLVTANFASNYVSVLLNNGNGSFAAQTTYLGGTEANSVAVGDVNGDGKPDLVTTIFNNLSLVTVRLGTGNGSFGAQTSTTVGIRPGFVAVGDLNGDAKPDLVTANQGTNTVSVLLNCPVFPLFLVTSATPNPVNAGATTALSVTASNGTAPYSYTWAAPAGITLSATSTSAVSASVGTGVSGIQTFTITAAASGGSPTSTSLVSLTVNPCNPVVYVTPGGAGLQDGSSWTNAFSGTALQTAINTAAVCAAQVWVAAGTYKPTTGTDRTISFEMRNGVSIYGGFAGGELTLSARVLTSPSSTTLSGDIDNDGTLANNSFQVIRNNDLNNTAGLDGFLITGGNANQPFPLERGAGMLNNNSSPTLTNLTFIANSAELGAGVFNSGGSARLTNCNFQANTSTLFGGAIYSDGFSTYSVTNSTFQYNTAVYGGAICSLGGSTPTLTNCGFLSNSATVGGGVLVSDNSNPKLLNCSFLNNQSSNGGITATYDNSVPVFINCVAYGNGGSNTFNAPVTATYSLFEGTVTNYTTSPTNLTTTTSPFVSTTDLQLNACALAINAGTNSASGLSGITTDLAGNNRFYNGGTVDMGAYEFQGVGNSQTGITAQPVAGSVVCASTTVTASVSVSGTGPFTYQWYKDGSVVNGQTAATLSLTDVQTGDAGSYSAVVTGSCNSVTSTAFSLTVNANPTATLLPSSATLTCAKTSVTLTAGGGNSYTFTNESGTVIGTPGASNTLVVSSAGTYSVLVANISGCTSITTATVSNTLTTLLTWTGQTSTDWNVANNWCPARVPLTTDDVVIPSAPTNQPVLSTTAVAKSVVVNSGASLSITAAGSLTINSSRNNNGFLNSGTVANRGLIVIGSLSTVTGSGLANTGTFQNTAGGIIQIDRTTGDGVSNQAGTFTNSATITVGASATVGGAGIGTQTTFFNNPGGLIRVDRTTGNGINNLASTFTNSATITVGTSATVGGVGIRNQASFLNNPGGLIQVDRTTSNGITNAAGTFTNSATITLGSSATVGGAGIFNQTTFLNNPGGLIQIDRTTSNGITNVAGTFTNSATIMVGASATVGGAGIFTQTTFFNNPGGLIQIDRTIGNGITNAAGTFTNSATITVGASASVGASGIGNQAIFLNNAGGIIQIDRTGTQGIGTTGGTFTNAAIIKIGSLTTVNGNGIQVAGSTFTNNPGGNININRSNGGVNNVVGATFTNSSTLTIGNVAFSTQDNIFNRGTFLNTATGEIRADRSTGNGIWNYEGSFQNAGLIVLGANARTGSSGINNLATFTNTAGGDIVIDRPSGTALNNANANAVFTNAARIQIGQNFTVGNFGLVNSGSAIFRNNPGGTIAIDRTNNDGISNVTSSTFVNSSTITVGLSGSIAGDGIENSATFSNSACATLTVFDNINNSGEFTNAGLFTVKTSQPHSNTGTLTNNGIIEYPLGNPIPSVVNNDVIAAPISSCSSLTITPALQLGATSNQFTVGTTWYSDPALTQSAGTYDQATNTFTATSLTIGSSSTLFFAATDNANTCTKTVSVSVTLNAAVTASITPSAMTVCAGTPVSLTASGTPGGPGTSYLWNTGATSQVISVSTTGPSGPTGIPGSPTGPAGPYSVTVTTAAGCSGSATITLTIIPVPVASISPSTLTVCQGQPASLTASGGSVYLWSTGETTAVINVTATGTYSVTVSGVASVTGPTGPTGPARLAAETVCSSTASATVTVNALPTAGLVSSGTLTCAQTSITLTASGGTSYTFINGSGIVVGTPGASNTLVVNNPETYSVIVANASGCTATTSTTVISSTNAPALSINPSSATLTCINPTVSLTAVGTGTYLWSTGATTQTISATLADTYSVTLTGANGCTATASAEVFQDITPPSVSINPASATLTCTTPTVSLTAVGTGTYRWNTGAITQSISVTSANTYSVTLTGANGCTATASVVVSADQNPASVSISPSTGTPAGTTLTCATPSVSLSAVGSGTYRWNTGATTSVISATSMGTYSVTLTGANGCTATASAQVFQDNTPPSVSISPASATLTCATPSVSLSAVGSGTYQWSTGATSQIISVTFASTYSVTLTGANGCTAMASVVVSADQTAPSVSINPTSATLTCATPTVSLTAIGSGTYRWSTGATSQIISATLADTYSVTLTGANGCTATASTQVFQDISVPTVSISPSSATLTCISPSVSLTAIGTGSVRWSTGQTTPIISVSAAATYSVTLTGSNGCTATVSVVVSADQNAPSVSISPTSATLTCASPSVSLTAVGSGTYRWSTGAATSVISATSAGTYSVTLTGVNGCTATASAQVFQDNTAPTVSINPASATLTCATPSVSLTAVGSGTYRWSTGATTQTISVTSANTYSVTLTGANGCTAMASVLVGTDQNPPLVSIAPISATLTCTTSSVSLTAIGNGTYRWSTGATSQIISATSAGTYSVTLTGANGCTASASASVSYQNCAPTLANAIPSQTATMGSPYSYTIPPTTFTDAETPNSLTLSVVGLPAGLSFVAPGTITGSPSTTVGSPFTVTVVATDPGGLSASTSFTLTVQPTSFAITGVTMLDCNHVGYFERRINFMVSYSGTNGQPISISVVNELTATTVNGPYQLNVFTDNPVIVLRARQQGTPGEATFSYNWLAYCANGNPRVENPISPQSATVGQPFSYTIPANTFTDAETPNSLTLSVLGLPAGLSFVAPNTITGTVSASVSSFYSVTVIATDPSGGAISTLLPLSVISPSGCVSMYTVKAGDWSDASVWSCGRVPVSTDAVTLNHVVSLPASYVAQAKSLRYGAGGKLTYQTGATLKLGF